FFFSSRRRHTRFSRDWSSDVCSSDLNVAARDFLTQLNQLLTIITKNYLLGAMYHHLAKVELAEENYDAALENLDRANRILNEKKCWNLYGYVLLAKGMAHKFSEIGRASCRERV